MKYSEKVLFSQFQHIIMEKLVQSLQKKGHHRVQYTIQAKDSLTIGRILKKNVFLLISVIYGTRHVYTRCIIYGTARTYTLTASITFHERREHNISAEALTSPHAVLQSENHLISTVARSLNSFF